MDDVKDETTSDPKDDAKDGAPHTPAIDLAQAQDAPIAQAPDFAANTVPNDLASLLALTDAPDALDEALALNQATLATGEPADSAAPEDTPTAFSSFATHTLPATFGPYVVLRRLGGGALGEVYLAAPRTAMVAPGQAAPPTQRALASLVAIKFLYTPARDPGAREVADRTRQAASLLKAESIPLYELITADDRLGLVMGFAPRGSLGDALNRRDERRLAPPLGPRVVARLVTQLGRALAALHAAGLAHGDLTPNNIFVHRGADGAPRLALADLGQGALAPQVARTLATEAPETDEMRAWAALQRRFAAPERDVSGATPAGDQYALATLAYFLLTGRAPTSVQEATQPGEETIPSSQPSTTPTPAVVAILQRALSQQPDARYPTIEAFSVALTTTLDPDFAASDAPPAPALAPRKPLVAPTASVRRPMIVALALGLMIALCILSVGVYAFSGVGVYHPPTSVRLEHSVSPSATPTPTLTPAEQLANASAASLRQRSPAYSDPLDGGAKTWAISPGVFYSADGHLHLANANATPLVVDDPSHATQSDPLVQVTITFVRGSASSLAGVRFFVTQNDDKTYNSMAYLIAPYGHFALWLNQHGVWTVLISGYTPSLDVGMNRPNTLAAMADGPDGVITLFANGQVIAQVYLPTDYSGPTSGTLGLIVLSHGAEVAYTRYAVYASAAPTATPTP